EIFLAELDRTLLRPLLAARRGRDTLACLTDLDRRRQELWQPGAAAAGAGLILRDAPALLAGVEQAFQTEQNQLLEIEGRRVFVQILAAPLRLIVVGA